MAPSKLFPWKSVTTSKYFLPYMKQDKRGLLQIRVSLHIFPNALCAMLHGFLIRRCPRLFLIYSGTIKHLCAYTRACIIKMNQYKLNELGLAYLFHLYSLFTS
jgi:hypothetical protein